MFLLLWETGSKWTHVEYHILNLLFHFVRKWKKSYKIQLLRVLIMIVRFIYVYHHYIYEKLVNQLNIKLWHERHIHGLRKWLDLGSIIKYGSCVYSKIVFYHRILVYTFSQSFKRLLISGEYKYICNVLHFFLISHFG
jgi:hypothetical protein